MLSMLLCLIIVLESFLSAESFNKPGFKALAKRNFNVDKVIEIYDAARTDTWALSGVIPHPECAVPFFICKACDLGGPSYGPYTCLSDRGGDELWCSRVKKHTPTQSRYESCIMKGTEVANSNKWRAPTSCVRIFLLYNANRRKWYYYKGCTTYNSEKPWCAHHYSFKSGKWNYCIDMTPPKWGEWEDWSACSQTCDEGIKTRTRRCLKEGIESPGCSGPGSESHSCFLINCPVNGGWSVWNQWTNCSAICGNGSSIRVRQCDNPSPKYNGTKCEGKAIERKDCHLRECTKKEEKEEKVLKKVSTKNNKNLYLIITIGAALLAVAVLIAVVIYRKKKTGNSSIEPFYLFYQESTE